MSDYIKREDAYSACCYETPEFYMARKEIKAVPSVDVVEVVRCKDCRWWVPSFKGCEANPCVVSRKSQDFCSMGERKDETI